MKKIALSTLFLYFISLLLFTRCEKENNDSPKKSYVAPSITQSEEIYSLSPDVENNENYNIANDLVGSINSTFSSFSSFLKEIPDDAVCTQTKSIVDQWTWKIGGVDFRLRVTYNETNTKWQYYYNELLWVDVTEYKLKNEYLLNGYDNGSLKVNYHSIEVGNQRTVTCVLFGEKTFFVNEISSISESVSYIHSFDAYQGSDITGEHCIHLSWQSATSDATGWIKDLETGKTISVPIKL